MNRPRDRGRGPAAAALAFAFALALVALCCAARVAAAQPAAPLPQQPAPAGQVGAGDARREGGPEEAPPPPGEGVGFQNGRATAVFFWIFALLAVAGSIFVITRRNLVAAVMGMVGTFFALAALYTMLYAHFLAVIQVLVYAGAIMVLFVFVVMILNRPEEEPWALEGLLGKALAGLAILYLVGRLSVVLWDIKDRPHAAVAAPRPAPISVVVQGGAAEHPSKAEPREDAWGSTRAVGRVLFGRYLFPFEAVSLILLVAVVGGVALSRPPRRDKAEIAEKPESAA